MCIKAMHCSQMVRTIRVHRWSFNNSSNDDAVAKLESLEYKITRLSTFKN